jgi:pyruvate,water dikinase
LRQKLIQLLGPHEGEQLLGRLVTGLEGDVTVDQNLQLSEVACGLHSLDDFLAGYGHRAVNEMELAEPRWHEDRRFVDQMIDRFKSSPATAARERHTQQAAIRRQAEANLPSTLVTAGGSFLREVIEDSLRQAQQLLPYRELGKFHLMRGYQTIREVLLELGSRLDLGRDIFFLQVIELADVVSDRSTVEARIADRKLNWKAYQKLTLPDVIDSRQLDDFGQLRPPTGPGDQDRLACRSIASGVARGTARLVFSPGDAADLGRDYILVCPSTDPGWTPLFVHARGLIVERGGVLSHGAIVARDFGIPAVVLEGATQLIRDGAVVDLDANQGTIRLNRNENPRTGKGDT